MNELNLYAIFKAVLSKSKVMEGRFHVAPGYGNDLNTNNIGAMVKDVMGNMGSSDKYPVAIMMPPVEVVPDSLKGWARFKIRMFFLTRQEPYAYQTDGSTNTGTHSIEYTWKDMRECASDFKTALEKVILRQGAINQIRPVTNTDIIERFSSVANDKLAGISISFDMDLYMPCEMKDYRDIDLDAITLNLTDIHQLHKH